MKHDRIVVLALAGLVALGLAPGLAAQPTEPFRLDLARPLAMGGSHAALADDWGLLFANPAGLASAKPRLFVAQVGARASGPLFDMAQAFLGGGSMIDTFVSVLKANDYSLYTTADIAGPLSFGYVGKGLGFGLFNRTHAVVDAAGISSVRILAAEDILLVGGYAVGLDLGPNHRLEAGILAKGFARASADKATDALSLVSIVGDPLGLPFTIGTGIGIDVGLRWAWTAGFSAGLACRDLYSPLLLSRYTSVQGFLDGASTALVSSIPSEVRRNLVVSLAYSMPPGGLWGLVDGLVIAADYSHLLDLLETFHRNPVLELGLGFELRVLDIIALRAGLSEGYPSAGASLDLAVTRLDLSVWGSELGQEPGSRPAFNLMVSLDFTY